MSASSPLVSVIIPTYNRAAILPQAIDSAFAQRKAGNGVRVEVIVVDDGSKDETPMVLERFTRHHGVALHVVRQNNAGAAAARNAGLDHASGEFIQFLDSDDMLYTDKLYLQLEALAEKPSTPVALCYGVLETASAAKRIGRNVGFRGADFVEALCGPTVHIIQTLSPLWRRAFLTAERRWDPSISLGDDLEFHIRCLIDAPSVAFVERELFTVRHHPGDQLSDFSNDDSRLASLFLTNRVIRRHLIKHGGWTPRCAKNNVDVLKSIYGNYLHRMPSAAISELERHVLSVISEANSVLSGTDFKALILLRQIAGQRLARTIASNTLNGTKKARRATSNALRVARSIANLSINSIVTSLRTLQELHAAAPSGPTLLLIEPNNYHIEVLPGYTALARSAGLDCWVIARRQTDVKGACTRLRPEQKPNRIFELDLWAIRLFLRCAPLEHFELVMLSSGEISEKNGYFGSAFDYFGVAPEGRLGNIVIEHSAANLRARRPRISPDKGRTFTLMPNESAGQKIDMLAPIEFGHFVQPLLDSEIIFVTIGRMEQKHRNLVALITAVENISITYSRSIKVIVIGSNQSDIKLPSTVSRMIDFRGYLPFSEMFNIIESAHFVLPLLDTQILAHRTYLDGVTSGSRQLILGFSKVGLWEKTFAHRYGFSEKNAIIYRPGRLHEAMSKAVSLDPAEYDNLSGEVGLLRKQVFQTSLSNLQQVFHNLK